MSIASELKLYFPPPFSGNETDSNEIWNKNSSSVLGEIASALIINVNLNKNDAEFTVELEHDKHDGYFPVHPQLNNLIFCLLTEIGWFGIEAR